jgi:hypothetical protein
MGTPCFWELDFVLEPDAGVELMEVSTSRARWMPLNIEWNASTNMFYLLKHLLLLILIIFKLKCNNLIFNEIMVLNALYVCLHAFSLRRESPDLDPIRWTPHFWGGSVTRVSHYVPRTKILGPVLSLTTLSKFSSPHYLSLCYCPRNYLTAAATCRPRSWPRSTPPPSCWLQSMLSPRPRPQSLPPPSSFSSRRPRPHLPRNVPPPSSSSSHRAWPHSLELRHHRQPRPHSLDL